MPKKPEETPSQRFERRIREGYRDVLHAAKHPVKLDQVEPLSADRLRFVRESDLRLLGACAKALSICRTQEYTPVEDLIETILTAYARGDIGPSWDEIEMHYRLIGDYITCARGMLRHFPEEVMSR